jgi:hypothetical protein
MTRMDGAKPRPHTTEFAILLVKAERLMPCGKNLQDLLQFMTHVRHA